MRTSVKKDGTPTEPSLLNMCGDVLGEHAGRGFGEAVALGDEMAPRRRKPLRVSSGAAAPPEMKRRTLLRSVVAKFSWPGNGENFYPIGYIPSGVRLTGYGGEASDLPGDVLQRTLDDIAAGTLELPVSHVYDGLEQVRQAHADMAANAAAGKLVVRVRHVG